MTQPIWNFEQEPFTGERPDESSYNLRAYLERGTITSKTTAR